MTSLRIPGGLRWRGRDHPPLPLKPREPHGGQQLAAASGSGLASRSPAGWGQEEGHPGPGQTKETTQELPTETHPAFPTTDSSGKRALSFRTTFPSSEFSQVSRLALTSRDDENEIAEGSASSEKRRECWRVLKREFKELGVARKKKKTSIGQSSRGRSA